MRMTLWFESVQRRFGNVNGAKSRQHRRGRSPQQTSAFVESLEDRCLLAAGDLDSSFGSAGLVTTSFGTTFTKANSVAVQSDGAIVVAGRGSSALDNSGDNGSFALARYKSDGSLDASFDGDGRVTTDFGMSIDYAVSMVLQANGKIVVAGNILNGGYDFALARYNGDGSLDTSFDADGKLTTDFGSSSDFAKSVAVQADGKIVVAGKSFDRNGGVDDFALARYNVDGSLDTSFDGDGKLTTAFGSSDAYDEAFSVAVQPDGKIVAAGYTRNSNGDFAIARYNNDGALDTSFDGDGKLTTDFGMSDDQAISVTLQADGKILVAGSTSIQNGGKREFALVRYNNDGTLDASFDGDGKLTTGFGTGLDSSPFKVAVQADGKIVVAGRSHGTFALAVYNNDGSLDNSVDGDGRLTNDFGNSKVDITSMALQADGKIIVAGYVISGVVGSARNDFVIARLQSTAINEPPMFTSANVVTVQENTNIVQNVAASDPENDSLSYSIGGGVDDALFAINSATGALTFLTAPDFESPQDTDHNNVYETRVSVNDGSNTVAQDIHVTVTNINDAPLFATANSVSVTENTAAVMSIVATDAEHDSLSYFVSGGADQVLFDIDLSSGALSFKAAPDFEHPTDANHDNVYSIQVQVSDGTNLVTQNLSITVTNDVDESPTITSANTVSIPENTSFVFNVTATDPEGRLPLFGIVGGVDQAKFTLNFLTGALSFVSPPDFEHPTDTNHDSVYVVQVAVSDGTHLVTQDISVTVTNVNETVTIPLPANGGNFKTLFLNGQLHLRSSLGKPLIGPVTLSGGADVQFNGSNAADRLTLDRSWSGFTGSLTFNGNGGNDSLDARAISLGVRFNGGDGNDTFLGGSGDDTADGGLGLDSLTTGDGNDSLTGGDGNDKLFAGAGDDTAIGGTGNDSINGGDGDDSLAGGDGNDTLTGDDGDDIMTGDAGTDSLNGGADNDVLFGNANRDTLDGGTGDDVLDGGDDNDSLRGSDGDDSIRGGFGNDTLSGGNGNDLLTGSAGNDSLLGDAGMDTLLGDDGNDKLNGGTDLDTINGVTTGPSKDTISDSTKVIDTSFAFDFDDLLADLL